MLAKTIFDARGAAINTGKTLLIYEIISKRSFVQYCQYSDYFSHDYLSRTNIEKIHHTSSCKA
jgi:hypothetical protein